MGPTRANGDSYLDTACLEGLLSSFSALFASRFALLGVEGDLVAGDWPAGSALPDPDEIARAGWLEAPQQGGRVAAFMAIESLGQGWYLLACDTHSRALAGGVSIETVMRQLKGLIEVALQKELQLEGLAHETLLRYEELNLLYEMGEAMISSAAIDQIVAQMLEKAVASTEAQGGAIVLLEEGGGESLVVQAAWGWRSELALAGKRFPLGEGVIGAAIAQRRPQIVADALDDQLYGEKGRPVRLKSFMCIPLSTTARLVGGIVLMNKRDDRYFTASDEKLALAVGTQAAIAIENNRLQLRIREEERIGANLQRYVSPNVVQAVLGRGGLQELIGDRWDATILFIDIRDFSVVVEKTPPEIMIALLNEYFRAVTEIIFEHQGAIDEFAGDELLAFFGIPFATPRGAEEAVRAAIEIVRRLDELKADWELRGLPIFDAGLGMNTGSVAVGNIGSDRRMELTVVGPPVVIASRVEELNKELGTRILVTEETLAQVRDIVIYRDMGTHQLQGISRPTRVFEVIGLREDA